MRRRRDDGSERLICSIASYLFNSQSGEEDRAYYKADGIPIALKHNEYVIPSETYKSPVKLGVKLPRMWSTASKPGSSFPITQHPPLWIRGA